MTTTTEHAEQSRDTTAEVIFGGGRSGTRPVWFKPVQLNLWREGAEQLKRSTIDTTDPIRPDNRKGARR